MDMTTAISIRVFRTIVSSFTSPKAVSFDRNGCSDEYDDVRAKHDAQANIIDPKKTCATENGVDIGRKRR